MNPTPITRKQLEDHAEAMRREKIAVEYHDALVLVLRDLLSQIPQRRDWLNPDTERAAKSILAEIDQKSK